MPASPRLPQHLTPVFAENLEEMLTVPYEDDRRLHALSCTGLTIANADLSELRLSGTVFRGCRITNSCLTNADFSDTAFFDCDLSGCDFTNASFLRCSFTGCKAMGLELSEAGLREVSFLHCRLDYLNAVRLRLRAALLEECSLIQSVFQESELHRPTLRRVDFTGTTFLHTSLLDVDFASHCILEGLRADTASLKGAIISQTQAAALAPIFGLVVRNA